MWFTVHLNFFQVKVFGTCIHEEKERNKQLEDKLHSKLVENNKLSEMMAHMREQVCKISQTCRLVPVLKTIVHQCVISYTCGQSNSDGSVLSLKTEPSEVDWLQVYDMTH